MKQLTLVLLTVICQCTFAQSFVSDKAGYTLPGTIYVDAKEDWLVQKSAELLQSDIGKVTGVKPAIIHTPDHSPMIIIRCVPDGRWEAFRIQTKGNQLLLTGSDKRGTAYAVMELSRQLGVSPWYWWADVPVKKKKAVFIKEGTYDYPSPSVKYRGIFINDEAPAFAEWTKEKFGGFNHLVYEKVFELILRLKGNYLWPAMWGNSFYTDDTLNPVLADKWGIVIGTTHHEPMMRAHVEWKKTGDWNYVTNEKVLREFWRTGIQRMGTHESIVSIGMRGDGDEPMTRGTATALLERIVRDQRQIISEVTDRQIPQMWALYKEVQDYYDRGMRVPDDVTLLLCDDNWGNIRKLPKLGEAPRQGGYGIYYHFDYVGDPRNYKWINTNNIARVWEQMHLAKAYGADKLWVVNVGDIKPMEFPISFFLDYAWNTNAWNEDNLRDYYKKWAVEQFNDPRIGDLLRLYGQYASRKKPELLDARTYTASEAARITTKWTSLLARAENITVPPEYENAYFQLVLHPIKAFTILHQMYYKDVQRYYIEDSLLSLQYNRLADGKWNHMMDQTHIGYTGWQQPSVNKMPVSIPLLKDSVNEIVIPATAYTKLVNGPGIKWKRIPDIAKDGDGMTTFPVTVSNAFLKSRLEYNITCDTGIVNITALFSPTLNFHNEDGLKYAISIDDEPPQIIAINKDDKDWSKWVADNIIEKKTHHLVTTAGKHIIKYWMVSPAVILQQIKYSL